LTNVAETANGILLPPLEMKK